MEIEQDKSFFKTTEEESETFEFPFLPPTLPNTPEHPETPDLPPLNGFWTHLDNPYLPRQFLLIWISKQKKFLTKSKQLNKEF